MYTVTSVQGSAVSGDELCRILADYVALDRARGMRRLFVLRFGLLALAAAVAGTLLHGLSPLARGVPLALFLIPPVWAWLVERRLERRLFGRLDDIDPATTQS